VDGNNFCKNVHWIVYMDVNIHYFGIIFGGRKQ
jgi:hypothetical protein